MTSSARKRCRSVASRLSMILSRPRSSDLRERSMLRVSAPATERGDDGKRAGVGETIERVARSRPPDELPILALVDEKARPNNRPRNRARNKCRARARCAGAAPRVAARGAAAGCARRFVSGENARKRVRRLIRRDAPIHPARAQFLRASPRSCRKREHPRRNVPPSRRASCRAGRLRFFRPQNRAPRPKSIQSFIAASGASCRGKVALESRRPWLVRLQLRMISFEKATDHGARSCHHFESRPRLRLSRSGLANLQLRHRRASERDRRPAAMAQQAARKFFEATAMRSRFRFPA